MKKRELCGGSCLVELLILWQQSRNEPPQFAPWRFRMDENLDTSVFFPGEGTEVIYENSSDDD